jgi:hypothetical protein
MKDYMQKSLYLILLLVFSGMVLAAEEGKKEKTEPAKSSSQTQNSGPYYHGMGPGHMMGGHMMGMGPGHMMGRHMGMGPGYGRWGMRGRKGMMTGMPMMYSSLRFIDKSKRPQVRKILTDLQKQNWQKMGKIIDLRAKLAQLYDADTLDVKAISQIYNQMFQIRRQMMEARLNAYQDIKKIVPNFENVPMAHGMMMHGMM